MSMSQLPVRYRIEPKHPEAHLFEVCCTVEQPDARGQQLTLPTWIPGSYMIREFAKNVVRLTACDVSGPIAVAKLDKTTWQCEPCSSPLTITYEVYAWDLSVRGAHLDQTHAYFNGTSVFVQVAGQTHQPCSVEIVRPGGERYEQWRVATTLPRLAAPPYGFGTYQAADYDELADHPVEIGDFVLTTFDVRGIPHDVAIYGRQRADLQRLTRDLKAICDTHVDLFGELPPIDRYLFLIMAVGEGYGGLEHRSCCSLLCSRFDLPRPGLNAADEDYRRFLGLCSHEYFHTWNVKCIKPSVFIPYDLSQERYTRQLWAFEGITSYYDDLALVRSGVIDENAYLQLLGETATRVWRGPGRFKQSVAESSFDAWTKFYRQDENAPNAIVSYYTKGALLALALDLLIRDTSSDERSLDDVMRLLWQRHGRPGIGVPEGGVEDIVNEIAGQDLSPFFAEHLYGTADPPLERLLAAVGIRFELRPAWDANDKGGKATKPNTVPLPTLGIRTAAREQGAEILNVFDDGAAQAAGLAAGDIIIAIEGLKASQTNLGKLLQRHRPGERLRLHAFRRDELLAFSVILKAPPRDTAELSVMDEQTMTVQRARASWLHNTRKEIEL
ncbi:MAG: peptidase M61 [Gammaproteobacteria bacterium SG8_47]|nr:MAG: peptidase M61 [Gammaproteobacteria bacterium SG8_47]